jgi:cobalt-precorrin 5A hydrolase/precorrin-3B C17-methyltransferase
MNPPAILILSEQSVAIARRLQVILSGSLIYSLAGRTQSGDIPFAQFGDTVRDLYTQNTPIIGICAAGILIRTLAPLLANKHAEPPVIAVAEDGSAVVPLLGGLTGVNTLATTIATALQTHAAITATGQLRFNIVLEAPPLHYALLNPEHTKSFTSDLLAGALVKLVGESTWLSQSNLPFAEDGTHILEVVDANTEERLLRQRGSSTHLIYRFKPLSKLAIIGTGPGALHWMSPEVRVMLQDATDIVGYKTYLVLIASLIQGKRLHESDNRVECDRARHALNLAAEGRSVVLVSSGDPGIYAMAAAVFEVLEGEARPEWRDIDIQVAPGISAMQAAAAAVGAPLGHDFCAISLSDILKPWSVIERRIMAAAQADFAIAFYNPASQQRTEQLQRALEILLQWRSPETPVILARSLGRPGAMVKVTSLAKLMPEAVNMQTILLIGSSQTRIFGRSQQEQWVYTPRHYSIESQNSITTK